MYRWNVWEGRKDGFPLDTGGNDGEGWLGEKGLDVVLEKEEGLIECGVYFGFGAGCFGWVGNTPMQFLWLTGKDRAGFACCLIADGDDEVKGRIGQVIP